MKPEDDRALREANKVYGHGSEERDRDLGGILLFAIAIMAAVLLLANC